jgi:hypothetical protein
MCIYKALLTGTPRFRLRLLILQCVVNHLVKQQHEEKFTLYVWTRAAHDCTAELTIFVRKITVNHRKCTAKITVFFTGTLQEQTKEVIIRQKVA